jgi:hypothetical protein
VKRILRRRFWVETALATLSAVTALLTALWQDWIEIIFRVDPDHHNGALEWAIVMTCIAATIVCIALARREWQKSPVAPEAA